MNWSRQTRRYLATDCRARSSLSWELRRSESCTKDWVPPRTRDRTLGHRIHRRAQGWQERHTGSLSTLRGRAALRYNCARGLKPLAPRWGWRLPFSKCLWASQGGFTWRSLSVLTGHRRGMVRGTLKLERCSSEGASCLSRHITTRTCQLSSSHTLGAWCIQARRAWLTCRLARKFKGGTTLGIYRGPRAIQSWGTLREAKQATVSATFFFCRGKLARTYCWGREPTGILGALEWRATPWCHCTRGLKTLWPPRGRLPLRRLAQRQGSTWGTLTVHRHFCTQSSRHILGRGTLEVERWAISKGTSCLSRCIVTRACQLSASSALGAWCILAVRAMSSGRLTNT